MNTTFRLAPWADALYACDYEWWLEHVGAIEFAGLRVSQDQRVCDEFGLFRVPLRSVNEFSFDPMWIGSGGNGGFQALNLAVHLGCNPIILLGFDMGDPGHWHGDHPASLRNPGADALQRWRENMTQAAPALADRGIRVLNASRKTALECFPRMELHKALEVCHGHATGIRRL